MLLDIRRILKSVFLHKAGLLRRVETLETETADLRTRLVTAQSAKLAAEAQAEELRSDKERLRARIASQKKAADQERRVTDQLRAKFEDLQKEHARLKDKLKG